MTARSFVWLSIGGGAWSLGSNWADVTDGISPSLDPPGAQDSVTVTGPSGARMQTINGGGTAAAGLFAGNTLLSGAFSVGTLTMGGTGAGALLQLGAGTTLSDDGATIASGSLLMGGGSTFLVAGTLALGTVGGAGATLNATSGCAAAVLALALNAAADSIYVDPTSILEVGSAQTGAAGYLTIDAGSVLSGQGSADTFGKVANNGTLAASAGTLTAGALSGTGILQIGAGATLALGGVCGAGQDVVFAGAGATLALKQEAFAPAGTLTGFTTGDSIDVRGSTISSASFSATSPSGGVLTLFYGTQAAARLNLAGSYAGSVFLTSRDGAGGTQITVTPASGGNGGPSPGTSTPDDYAWTAAGSGAWNQAANWQDLTTGAAPAAIAPGAADLVSITADADSFCVISGPANAATVALTGEVALSGAYQIGTLTVGQSDGTAFTPGTLDVLAGSAVSAGNAAIADGAISVYGSAALLSVAGTLVLGGRDVSGVGLPTADVLAASGGGVRAAGLVMGGGSGATLTTDPTGWVEIGGTGHQSAGAITIDAGGTLSGNGAANPLGALIDNGTILAAGGTLSLGSVSGSGSLEIASGATLELDAATAAPIVLDGTASSGSTLALTSVRAAPTGTLTGFALGNAIDLEGSSLTSAQFSPSGSGGSLLLIYNTMVVARIALATALVGQHFIATPDGAGGSLITAVANAGGGGGGGQTGTDQLAWATQGSGNWNHASSWMDMTIGAPATSPPGSQTPVLIAGPGGTQFQSVGGNGICANLVLTGNTALSGSYTTGLLCIGQAASGSTPSVVGALDIGPNTAVNAATGTLASGELLCGGANAVIDVAGTLALGGAEAGVGQPDALLAVTGHGSVRLGGLTLGGGDSDAVTVDSISTLEIGTAGTALAGVFTVDPGAFVSGNGTLNAAAPVADNGSIVAQGGTLTVGGTITGIGTLGIGTEATLVLGGADSCAIAFVGGGATLVMPGSAQLPTGVISGFAPGDSILTGSPVDSVTYVPGAGGVGTLTMSVAGQAAGRLLLAGSFAGDVFGVAPDGQGAAILVSPPGVIGPPPGTVTPDAYRWTGAAGNAAWSDAGNWTDVTQGQSPATLAPGQNDTVVIAGGTGAALAVIGPADAAGLSITGTVSLGGNISLGTLTVGSAQGLGVLALGAGAYVAAASGVVTGGLAVDGGVLTVDGTLTLGSTGALAAAGSSQIRLGAAMLDGAGSMLATDATASIEIGAAGDAMSGAITVDAGNLLEGAGSVGLSGQVIDQGTVAASGGTLVLGDVVGTGTLLAGADADLVLSGTIDSALTADFAAAGTLTLAGTGIPKIEDFGTRDSILLPVSGAATASYTATGAGIGVLSVLDGNGAVLDRLTLLGSQAGRLFFVAATDGGGTVLTTQSDNMSGNPGETSMTNAFSTGANNYGTLLYALEAAFPYVALADLQAAIGTVAQTVLLDYSTDGLPPADPSTLFGGNYDPEGGNLLIEVVAPLDGVTGGGAGPGSAIAMQPGYSAVLLQGGENVQLTDGALGHALLVGNGGSDQIAALGDGDTLVGATGANTVFYAKLQNANGSSSLPIDVYIHGGGNDTIAANTDNAAITTSGGAGTSTHSTVALGGAQNSVLSNGTDTIACQSPYGSDSVTSAGAAGSQGDVVYAPAQGLLSFINGAASSTVVGGSGGQMQVYGHGGATLLWAGDAEASYYFGGSGAATVIGGAGLTSVQGGSGPVTVFGGSGSGIYSGSAGSVFVVGTGASTVTASAGNAVYVSGAAPVSVAGSSGVSVFAGPSLGDDTFQAFAGNETLWGGAGDDHFMAGSGNDILVSGGGDDVFSFANGTVSGIDTVVGFVSGDSKIALHGFGSQTPTMSTAYGDTVINLQNGAQIIVLNDTHMTSTDFVLS